MNFDSIKRRALQSWASVGFLAVLCLILAILQYRWLGEVSVAERGRLKEGLNSALSRISSDFNNEMATIGSALRPSNAEIATEGREQAYAARYTQWMETYPTPNFIKNVALAVPAGKSVELKVLHTDTLSFVPSRWPEEWEPMQRVLSARVTGIYAGPAAPIFSTLFEIPRFRGQGPERPDQRLPEQEWLVLEFNADALRKEFIPRLIERHLGLAKHYRVQVLDRFGGGSVVFDSQSGGKPVSGEADGAVNLFDFNPFGGRRGPGFGPGFGGMKGGPPSTRKQGGPLPPDGPPGDGGRGRWRMEVRYASDSLDAIVARLRWRNLAISIAVLGLMLATASLLIRYSRQQQQLADQQMNFVAGVSHELRTPLTVIRTAAYNLKGRVATNPAQVEKYGKLVQEEAEKLTALVEQVLRFSSARAGHVIREKSPVSVENIIEEGVRSSRLGQEGVAIRVERDFEESLPLLMADELALRHAVQNLIDNAMKYGMDNDNWIGISARAIKNGREETVEIRVADTGAGIPADETGSIFDAFVRGRRAIQDQIHGTGLGLNLVKRIVEAHGGSIRVESRPMERTEFIMRIPAMPAEHQDEFAHTTG